MKKLLLILSFGLCNCIAQYGDKISEPELAKTKLAAAMNAKVERERDPHYKESIRPTVILFHDITKIMKEVKLSKAQKSELLEVALLEFEKLRNLDESWTGEHSESANLYFEEMFGLVGDAELSVLLSGNQFARVRSMIVWTGVIGPKFPITFGILKKERRVDFPLFSGYGRQIPDQWKAAQPSN